MPFFRAPAGPQAAGRHGHHRSCAAGAARPRPPSCPGSSPTRPARARPAVEPWPTWTGWPPPRRRRGGWAPATTGAPTARGAPAPRRWPRRCSAAIRDSNQRSPPLRAIIACDEEDVRRQARASAERWRRGSPLSLLDGVPIAVKDELDQVPYPTTAGHPRLRDRARRADATPVARLRAAGALLVGKANMHEIGLGVTGMNPHTGFCRNPWDPGRVTGGSSSGPGARGRLGPGADRAGRRRGRLDPHPGGPVRGGRAEADLRPGQRARRLPHLLDGGPRGAAGRHRARLRAGLRRVRGTRSARSASPPAGRPSASRA